MQFQYIPNELLDIILEYDGRIKYKNGNIRATRIS